MLESSIKQIPDIHSEQDAYAAVKTQAVNKFINGLVRDIERQAFEFQQIKVTE